MNELESCFSLTGMTSEAIVDLILERTPICGCGTRVSMRLPGSRLVTESCRPLSLGTNQRPGWLSLN